MEVIICQGIQNTQQRIVVFLPKDDSLLDKIKQVYGRRWCPEHKCWHFPYNTEQWKFFNQLFRDIPYHLDEERVIELPPPRKYTRQAKGAKRVYGKKQLNVKQKNALTALEEKLLLERKSWRTIKTYKNMLIGLMLHYPGILPSKISRKQIQGYLLHRIKTDKIAISTQNQLINALKAFYERVLNQEDKVFFERPKKPTNLPNVFSKSEVQLLLRAVDNLKHKTILALIYSAGLRRSEVLNLRIGDILYARKCIFVKDAKGNKDRYVLLSENAEVLLKRYISQYKPAHWLFEGQTAGRYSETSIQKIFERAKEKSGVNAYVTLHGLRHSFATHMLENGVPLTVIKEMLGHNSLKTTEIYLHISNQYRKQMKSPLDDLDIL